MTATHAAEIEAEWAARHERQRWLYLIQSFGITDEDFATEELRSAARGDKQNPRETARAFLFQIISSSSSAHTSQRAYHYLALLADEAGEDFVPFLRERARYSLEHYRIAGITHVEISTAGSNNACESCLQLSGRRFSVAEALNTMPLPCADCTQIVGTQAGFCRCSYLAVIGSM